MEIINKILNSAETRFRSAVVLGAGGGANFIICKFLLSLGFGVTAYDLSESENIKELISLGAKFIQGNPNQYGFDDADLIIYSNAFPDKIIKEIKVENDNSKVVEVGDLYNQIISAYESDEFKNQELFLKAVEVSNLAPLYKLDFGDTILIGVTGTKGKTSLSTVLYDVFISLGFKASLISTISCKINGEEINTGFHVTTPSAQDTYKYLKKSLAAGVKFIIIEATSHGLSTGRLAGLKFDYGIINNIHPEHLDAHGTMDAYIEAKQSLLTKYLKSDGMAILNIDDENIREKVFPVVKRTVSRIRTVSLEDRKVVCDGIECEFFNAEKFAFNLDSLKFNLKTSANKDLEQEYEVPFVGKFNAYNVLPSLAICADLKIEASKIKNALAQVGSIKGRNEILIKEPLIAVLDFAHTPDSLETILKTYDQFKKAGSKIIVVFGCAGKRDPSKRSKMGEIAAKLADITILTAEDPRSERLSDINDAIENGWHSTTNKNSEKKLIRFDDDSKNILVRQEAISKAFDVASNSDILIFTGKGHEQSLCFGTTEYPWDEKLEILKAFKDSKFNRTNK